MPIENKGDISQCPKTVFLSSEIQEEGIFFANIRQIALLLSFRK